MRSAALLAEIGVPAERVVITADPVIRMKKTDKAVGETILRRAGVTQDGRPVVGWAIRERNRDSRFVAEVLRSIRWLKETYNAQSVLIPSPYEEDGEVCRHIASQLPDDTAVCLDEKYLSEDMLSIIGCMDLLVGVRLHSLIYAAIMGVPLIGISYDPKCTAFLNSVGLDKLSTRDGYTAEAFETEAARVLANGAEQTACVKRHMDELSRKLDTNEEMICAIMKDEKKTQPSAPQKNEKSGVRTAGAISIVFLLTLFAKLLGVVREMVQANIFGTGVDANLYTASYNSTLYLFTTVCYALCIAAVPILTKEFAADRRRGERAANNLMTVTLLGALVVGHGGAAGVPDLGGPDLGVVAVADDGHVLFQPGVGAQLCRQQDASLLVRHHLAGGAEQIAGDSPAVHQLIAFQLVRQPLDFLHGQCEQAVVHPFQHHKALAHGVAEFCGEVQPPLGIDGVIITAKKHALLPLSGAFSGCMPYFYPLCPTDTSLL